MTIYVKLHFAVRRKCTVKNRLDFSCKNKLFFYK